MRALIWLLRRTAQAAEAAAAVSDNGLQRRRLYSLADVLKAQANSCEREKV